MKIAKWSFLILISSLSHAKNTDELFQASSLDSGMGAKIKFTKIFEIKSSKIPNRKISIDSNNSCELSAISDAEKVTISSGSDWKISPKNVFKDQHTPIVFELTNSDGKNIYMNCYLTQDGQVLLWREPENSAAPSEKSDKCKKDGGNPIPSIMQSIFRDVRGPLTIPAIDCFKTVDKPTNTQVVNAFKKMGISISWPPPPKSEVWGDELRKKKKQVIESAK